MDVDEARRRIRMSPQGDVLLDCLETLINAAIVDHDHDVYNATPHDLRTKRGHRISHGFDASPSTTTTASASPRVDAMDVLLYAHQALVNAGITGYDPLAAHHGVDVLASMYQTANARVDEAAQLLDTTRAQLGRCRDVLARLLREAVSATDHSELVEVARAVLRNTAASEEEPVGAVLLHSEPQQTIRCVSCWARLGREHPADGAWPAVVVVEGRSLCATCARRHDAIWG